MPDTFACAFGVVVGEEGGYSADAADAGNWTGGAVGVGLLRGTKYGISAAAYPDLDIKHLTLADAQAIYRRDYWDRIGGDGLPAALALIVFDAAVNQGVDRAARWLQLAVGVAEDGIVGPETLHAAGAGDPLDVLAAIGWERDCSYHADAGWMHFGHGWIRRLSQILALSLVYDQNNAGTRWLPHPGGAS